MKTQELLKLSKNKQELDITHDDILGELDDELDEESPAAVADTPALPQLDARLLQQ